LTLQNSAYNIRRLVTVERIAPHEGGVRRSSGLKTGMTLLKPELLAVA
jgi:hypothetical protein